MKPLALVFTILLSSTMPAAADTAHAVLASHKNAHLSDSLHGGFLGQRDLDGRDVEIDVEGKEVLLSKEVDMVKDAMLSMSPKEIRELRQVTADIHFKHAADLDYAMKTMTPHQIRQLKQALRTLSATHISMLLANILEPIPICGQSLANLFSSLHPLKDLSQSEMSELAHQSGQVGRLLPEMLFKLADTLKHLVKPHEDNMATQDLTHLSIDELLGDVLYGMAEYLQKLPMGGGTTASEL